MARTTSVPMTMGLVSNEKRKTGFSSYDEMRAVAVRIASKYGFEIDRKDILFSKQVDYGRKARWLLKGNRMVLQFEGFDINTPRKYYSEAVTNIFRMKSGGEYREFSDDYKRYMDATRPYGPFRLDEDEKARRKFQRHIGRL